MNPHQPSPTLASLLERQSEAALKSPGPNNKLIDQAIEAALLAPDHGNLKPQQFRVLRGDAREAFGERLAQLLSEQNAEPAAIEKARQMPLRAPVIIAAAAKITDHPKVPAIEQEYCVAASVMMMQLAFDAQGFGSMWRTGWLLDHPGVIDALGFSSDCRLVAVLYVGTAKYHRKKTRELTLAQHRHFLNQQDIMANPHNTKQDEE